MVFSSSNLRNRLAPRCRLITSLYWRWHKGFDCSSIKVVRELGLERREPVWSLSTVKKKEMVFVLLREDRTIFTSCYLNIIRNCYVNTREQMKAYKQLKTTHFIFLENRSLSLLWTGNFFLLTCNAVCYFHSAFAILFELKFCKRCAKIQDVKNWKSRLQAKFFIEN